MKWNQFRWSCNASSAVLLVLALLVPSLAGAQGSDKNLEKLKSTAAEAAANRRPIHVKLRGKVESAGWIYQVQDSGFVFTE